MREGTVMDGKQEIDMGICIGIAIAIISFFSYRKIPVHFAGNGVADDLAIR